MKEENQLAIMKIDIRIKILYFGSKSKRLVKMGKEFLGCPLRKLNNLDTIVKTNISEMPAIRATGINEKNSFLLDFGKKENISKK